MAYHIGVAIEELAIVLLDGRLYALGVQSKILEQENRVSMVDEFIGQAELQNCIVKALGMQVFGHG